MFGFFRRLKYRSECAAVIAQMTGTDRNAAAKFIEEYKTLFNAGVKNNKRPIDIVAIVCHTLLKNRAKIEDHHLLLCTKVGVAVIDIDPTGMFTESFKNMLTEINNELAADPLVQEMEGVLK